MANDNLLTYMDEHMFVRGNEAVGVLVRFGIWCERQGWEFYDGYYSMIQHNTVSATEHVFKMFVKEQEDL